MEAVSPNRQTRRGDLFSKRPGRGKYHGSMVIGMLAHKAALERAKIAKEHHRRNMAARLLNKKIKATHNN